ncbi:nucleotidyltransferase domain-containing protein [Noviherbaspirillum massiliense]|uniref:nucleotidyltransferase domain-containing protein n=1 Tax=Noviherbaspirillum massiliense TaxID=1465823 RepID=UPI0002FA4B1D|nr:nucleotidyltransferase [Noviherbaspirillum massiliense]
MPDTILTSPADGALDADTIAFYQKILHILNDAGLPYLVGGAYAFNRYTGINRNTKDLDIFIRRSDFEGISEAMRRAGYETELTFPHWLGKIHAHDTYIDLIFSSGNGIAEVDDAWFEYAPATEVLGVQTKISPAEEMIWSKAFVMERERFDGADVMHLIQALGDRLDWRRLLARFGEHWRVLLSHLTLFGFIYPSDRDRVPAWLMDELIERLKQETHAPPPRDSLCLGTLLSREQYLNDIERQGLEDGRLIPIGNMTEQDTAHWTAAIPDERKGDGASQ